MNPVLPDKQKRKALKVALHAVKPVESSFSELADQTGHLEDINDKLGEIHSTLKDKKDNPNVLESVQGFLDTMKGEKGDQGLAGKDGKDGRNGHDGKTPVKGEDYLHEGDMNWLRENITTPEILKRATPVKGIHYFDGVRGPQGPEGVGKDGKIGPRGIQGLSGLDGKDGKDAKPLKADEVVEFIKKLPNEKKLDLSHLRNGSQLLGALGKLRNGQIHGGGIINIQENGIEITHEATAMNFTGATVTKSVVNGTNVVNVAVSGGSGIASINTDTTSAQLLVTGTSGTDFAIADNGTGTHTFNLPIASATNTGKLSSTDWNTFNNKGSGTVTAVSIASANGFSGSSSGGPTPALTIVAGAITPTSVNSIVLSGSSTPTLAVTGTSSISGSNTGDQTITLTGDVTGSGTGSFATTVAKISGTVVSGTTGSGNVVFSTSPTLTTAVLGSSTANTQALGDNSSKVATTAFVASAILGQNFKEAAKYGTTGALPSLIYSSGAGTLTGAGFGAITFDGSTPSVNDRVLVKNQVSTFQNGIYVVTVVGTAGTVFVLTRSSDANVSGDFETGDSIFITSGSTLSTTTWAYTGVDSPNFTSDAITYAQVAGQGSFSGGNGITITGTSIAIDTSITVDKTTAQTLTNKTLTSPNINEAVALTTTATKLNFLTSAGGTTGTTSTNIVFSTSPTLVTPALGTPASGVMTNMTGLPAASVLAGSLGTGAYIMDTKLTVPQVINTANTVTVTSNAGTVPVTSRINNFTNSSASAMTITMATSSAVDGQLSEVRIYDFSGVAESITWVNTENSSISVPITSAGSTTKPLYVILQFNGATSNWACVTSI